MTESEAKAYLGLITLRDGMKVYARSELIKEKKHCLSAGNTRWDVSISAWTEIGSWYDSFFKVTERYDNYDSRKDIETLYNFVMPHIIKGNEESCWNPPSRKEIIFTLIADKYYTKNRQMPPDTQKVTDFYKVRSDEDLCYILVFIEDHYLYLEIVTIAAGGDIYPEYLVRAKLELDSSAETVNKFKPDHPMLYHVVFTKEQWLGTGNARRQFGVSPKSEIGDSPIYKGSFADSYCEETITFLYNGKKTTCIGYNTYTYQDGYMDMDKYIAWWVNDYNAVLDLDNIKEEKDITVPKSIKNVMDTYHKDMILLLDYSISEYTQIIIYNYDAGNRSYWKRIYHVYK